MPDRSGEDRLLEALAADPSSAADTLLILAAARNDGLPWRSAWARAMRSFQPAQGEVISGEANERLAEERMLMSEVSFSYRAAYEGRTPTVAERRKARRRAENRLADIAA